MKFLKQLGIFVTQCLFYIVCFSQTPDRNRQIIDSLQRLLLSLHNTAEIDCLNELSWSYQFLRKDSMEFYGTLAYDKSVKLNYNHGIAESLSIKGNIEILFNNDYSKSVKLLYE